MICFQYREDAERVQAVLGKRLDKCALALEPSETKPQSGQSANLATLMRNIRHWSLRDRRGKLNQVLRGHPAYYGLAGNVRSMLELLRAVERYRHKMLCPRSWAASCTWEAFNNLKERFSLD